MFRRVRGYYNAADIRYNVVRYPDGKVIAENLAATEKPRAWPALASHSIRSEYLLSTVTCVPEEAVTEGHQNG